MLKGNFVLSSLNPMRTLTSNAVIFDALRKFTVKFITSGYWPDGVDWFSPSSKRIDPSSSPDSVVPLDFVIQTLMWSVVASLPLALTMIGTE